MTRSEEELRVGTADSGATPDAARRRASRVAHTAEDRPFPAIGVAFGAGFLLAWLIGRR